YPPVKAENEKKGFIEIGNGLLVVENVVRDMIKMWSTVDGFVSYRTEGGSYFVSSLCDAITEHKATKDVYEILQKVQLKVDNYNRDESQVTELQTIGFEKIFYFPSVTVVERSKLLNWHAYEMKRKSAGTCLIININKYEAKEKMRFGSEVDVSKLETIFKNLTYNVIVKNDLTAEQIGETIKHTLMHHTRKIDSFVLIVMAHGHTRFNGSVVIYGVDGNEVHINDVTELFNDRDCSNLRGKPKLLFINCCRGSKYECYIYNYMSNSKHFLTAVFDTKIKKKNIASNQGNVAHESFFTDEELETDVWDRNKKYQARNEQSQIRDTMYTFEGGVIKSTMREMILGTRLAEHLLRNLFTMKFNVYDLELMHMSKLFNIINGSVNHGTPSEFSAIGLRKLIYPFRLLGDDKSAYSSNSSYRGIAIIVDNSTRHTTINVDHAMIIFEKLKFKVVYLKNQTKEDILNIAAEYKSKDELKIYDYFVFGFHGRLNKIGKHNIIYGSDRGKVNIKQIMHMFNDDDCPNLKGKPKLFSFEYNGPEKFKAEDRSDDEILLCTDMANIFDAPMEMHMHLSGGCVVQFHTPFAVFETINDYLNQKSYLERTHNTFNDTTKNVMDFLTASCATRGDQSDQQNYCLDFLLNTIVESAISLTTSEITPLYKFKYASNANAFKYPANDIEQY
ncbi:caspase-9-like protein, partial [Leptotrombidium deliense]